MNQSSDSPQLALYLLGPPRTDVSKGTRELTDADLTNFNGVEPETRIYIAIKGEIFDVSSRRDLFGPEATSLWASYAGKDASRGWAKWSTSPDDCVSDVKDLTPDECARLELICAVFRLRFDRVGRMKKEKRAAKTR